MIANLLRVAPWSSTCAICLALLKLAGIEVDETQ